LKIWDYFLVQNLTSASPISYKGNEISRLSLLVLEI